MATNTISVEMLAKMFLAGAQNIEAKKEYINELNVFPVPDGDTGTNMSMTIMAAAKEVTALADMDLASVCKAISSGSLRGARGNSGVILSQLLRGFTKSIKEEEVLDVPAMARAAVLKLPQAIPTYKIVFPSARTQKMIGRLLLLGMILA